jgi:hypothetical protein
VADTLEMAGPWSDLAAIYTDVVAAINAVPGTLAGSAHQSHAYVDGACLYFRCAETWPWKTARSGIAPPGMPPTRC